MKKTIFILILLSFIISIGGCKSYVKKKWNDKNEEIDRTKLLNSEAKGSHVWYHERQTQQKYQKYTAQNQGTPNY